MATTFLEPGGDADFLVGTTNGFWGTNEGLTIATDFVHGAHIKSISMDASASRLFTKAGVCADAGTRMSAYMYTKTYPAGTTNFITFWQSGLVAAFNLAMTSTGILRLYQSATSTTQLGTNGQTLLLGKWYRISVAYTITSTTVNSINVYVDGVQTISVTNVTLANVTTSRFSIGNASDFSMSIRTSDHYADNSNSLTDTGNIWVTAKRPNANGTTNGFTTQIGAGGSGYGTGHAPQVNERPLSTTNGWSMVGAGSAITEEYNIEAQGVGDITTVGGTIVDYVGWVSASAALAETGSIVVNNVSSNIALTSTNTMFTKVAGSATYPAGTGTDIGIITSTTVTTVSLYECGIMVAFIPAATTNQLAALGAG